MRIDHMKYFGLVVVSLMLTACGGGGGGDDEPPAEVTINSASHSGEGCPAGTGDITLSADKKTVSVLFDGYEAEAGAGTGPVGQPGLTTKRVACNLAVSCSLSRLIRFSASSIKPRSVLAASSSVDSAATRASSTW